jgi:hypothetical protein
MTWRVLLTLFGKTTVAPPLSALDKNDFFTDVD